MCESLALAKDREMAPGPQFAEVKSRNISKRADCTLNVDGPNQLDQLCKMKPLRTALFGHW